MKNAPKTGNKILDGFMDIPSGSTTSRKEESGADRQLRLLEWAWEFLRRSPIYRNAYAQWATLPEVLKNDESLFELNRSGVLATFPVEFFDLDPEPIAGDNFGSWYDRQQLRQDEFSFTLAMKFDSASFMLAHWLNPLLTALPIPEQDNFFVPDFELEEARALDWHRGWPARRNYKSESEIQRNADQKIDVNLAPGFPITRTFPNRTTEHRWPSLNISADRPTQIALRFDLALPIQMQLRAAELQFLAARNEFKSTSEAEALHRFRSKEQPQAWPRMIRLLDARELTASDYEAVDSYLTSVEDGIDLSDLFDGLLTSLRRARLLRDGQYQGLIMEAFGVA